MSQAHPGPLVQSYDFEIQESPQAFPVLHSLQQDPFEIGSSVLPEHASITISDRMRNEVFIVRQLVNYESNIK